MTQDEVNKVRQLYDWAKEDGYDVGEYDTWVEEMRLEDGRRAIYDNLSKDENYDLGTWEHFSDEMNKGLGSMQAPVQPQAQTTVQPAEGQAPSDAVRAEYADTIMGNGDIVQGEKMETAQPDEAYNERMRGYQAGAEIGAKAASTTVANAKKNAPKEQPLQTAEPTQVQPQAQEEAPQTTQSAQETQTNYEPSGTPWLKENEPKPWENAPWNTMNVGDNKAVNEEWKAARQEQTATTQQLVSGTSSADAWKENATAMRRMDNAEFQRRVRGEEFDNTDNNFETFYQTSVAPTFKTERARADEEGTKAAAQYPSVTASNGMTVPNVMAAAAYEKATDPAVVTQNVIANLDGNALSQYVERRMHVDEQPMEGGIERQLTEEELNLVRDLIAAENGDVVTKLQQRMYQDYINEGGNMTTAGYILGNGFRNSLLMRLQDAIVTRIAGSSGLRKQFLDMAYQRAGERAGAIARGVSGAVTMIADAPAFGVAGKVAAPVAKGLIGAAGKAIAGRAAGELGAAAAERFIVANSRLGRVAENMVQSGLTFSGYDVMSEGVNQFQQGQFDAGELVNRAIKGFGTGAAVGVLGGATGELTKELTGFAKGVGKAYGFAAEVGLFTGMQGLEMAAELGIPITDVDWGALTIENAAMLGVLKLQSMPFRARMAKDVDLALNDYDIEELRRRGYDFGSVAEGLRSLKTINSGGEVNYTDKSGKPYSAGEQRKVNAMYAKFLADKDIPIDVKRKVRFYLEGEFTPYEPVFGMSEVRVNEDGTAMLETYSADGSVISRERFNSAQEAEGRRAELMDQVAVNQLSAYMKLAEHPLSNIHKMANMEAKGKGNTERERLWDIIDRASRGEELTQEEADTYLELYNNAADYGVRTSAEIFNGVAKNVKGRTGIDVQSLLADKTRKAVDWTPEEREAVHTYLDEIGRTLEFRGAFAEMQLRGSQEGAKVRIEGVPEEPIDEPITPQDGGGVPPETVEQAGAEYNDALSRLLALDGGTEMKNRIDGLLNVENSIDEEFVSEFIGSYGALGEELYNACMDYAKAEAKRRAVEDKAQQAADDIQKGYGETFEPAVNEDGRLTMGVYDGQSVVIKNWDNESDLVKILDARENETTVRKADIENVNLGMPFDEWVRMNTAGRVQTIFNNVNIAYQPQESVGGGLGMPQEVNGEGGAKPAEDGGPTDFPQGEIPPTGDNSPTPPTEPENIAPTKPTQPRTEGGMPLYEEGGKMKPDFKNATSEETYNYLYSERKMNRDDINAFVRNKVADAEKRLNKLEGKRPKMGTDLDEFEEKVNKWEKDKADTQKELDYWNDVQQRAKQENLDEQRENADLAAQWKKVAALDDAVSLHEYLMRQVYGGLKFIWDDADNKTKGLGSHLGLGNGAEKRSRRWLIGKKGDGALYPEQAAEWLVDRYKADTGNDVEYDEVFNTLLDILRGYDRKSVLGNDILKEHNAAQFNEDTFNKEDEKRSKDAWAVERGFTDFDSAEDYMKSLEGTERPQGEGNGEVPAELMGEPVVPTDLEKPQEPQAKEQPKEPETPAAQPQGTVENTGIDLDEVRRIARGFAEETPEQAAAFDKRIPDMSDEELLAYIREDGKGDVNKAYHMNLYDEYDSRHGDEELEARDYYFENLQNNGTTLEQAEEMLANIRADKESLATDMRPSILGQTDALSDYIAELRKQEEQPQEPAGTFNPIEEAKKNVEGKEKKGTGKTSANGEKKEAKKEESKSKWVNDEDADEFEEIRRKLREKLNQLNSGFDPEALQLSIRMAYLLMKHGVRKFADFAKQVIDAIGDGVRPHLKSIYAAAYYDPRFKDFRSEMTPLSEMEAFDVDNFDKKPKEETNGREKSEQQIAADTEAVASQAATVASEVESKLQAAGSEKELNALGSKVDDALDKVNEQLAVLGNYKADAVDADFNEAYGYMRNAEKKAVKNITDLSKTIVKELGITDPTVYDNNGEKAKNVRANIAPIGGDVTMRLTLDQEKGIELFMDFLLDSDVENNRDNLSLRSIMYRVEQPKNSGSDQYLTSNYYFDTNVSLDDMVSELKRVCKDWLPSEPIASENEVEAIKKIAKTPKKKKKTVSSQQNIPDLFSGLFNEEKIDNDNDTKGIGQTEGNSGEPGRVGGVSSDGNGILGTDGIGRTDGGGTSKVSDGAEPVANGEREELSSERGEGDVESGHNGNDKEQGGLSDSGRGNGNGNVEDGRDDDRGTTSTIRTIQTGGNRPNGVKGTGLAQPGGRRPVKPTKELEPKFQRNYIYPENSSEIDNMPPQQRLTSNVEALEVLRSLMNENRDATPEEREILGRYRGWGGVDLGQSYSTNALRNGTSGKWGIPTEKDKLLRRLADVIDELDPNGERGILNAINRAKLTSYYTPTAIAKDINRFFEAAGFKGGSMMDPSMGNGVFEGTMPKDVQQRTMINGIELDWLTGQIARRLYPDANVLVTGFEQADTPENAYDIVVSNIPFGDIRITDKSWTHNSSPVRKAAQNKIHNYFAVKMLDSTRPGGLCVIMTSNAILDTKGNQIIREYLADQAEILGVVRLPDNTFKGAGTKVVTDVIYLRKYKDDIDRADKRGDETYLENTERPFLSSDVMELVNPSDGKTYKVSMNAYLTKNREMMIGEPKAGGQYRKDEFGLGSTLDTDGIAESMSKLVDRHIVGDRKGKLFDTHKTEREVKQAVSEAYKGDGEFVSNGNIVEQDGKFGVVTNVKSKYGDATRMFTEMPGLKSKADRLRTMFPIRKAMKELISSEIDGESEERLKELRKDLQTAYDNFVKKYGRLNNKDNDFLTLDIDGYTLRSLEKWKEGQFEGLSDIFTKNTIKPALDLTKAKTPTDAIGLSLAEYGEIKPSFMEEILGESWVEQCGDVIFKLPYTEDTYVTADGYLSGDVKTKLAQAQKAAKYNKEFERNVKALEGVQPKDIPFDEISIRMGARWVPDEVYSDFLYDMFGINKDSYRGTKSGVVYLPEADTYVLNVNEKELGGDAEKWATPRKKPQEIFAAALQDKALKVYDKGDYDKPVINKEQTELANDKVQELRSAFEDWLSSNPEREEKLLRIYNDKFNRTVLRKWDGSHLNIPGLSGKELRPHQKDAVWMLINNRGGIVDHIVGAGKTLVMQSAIMEMRRMGIAKKPMIIALKATVSQIAKEFREAYPAARILAPTEKDFEKENRKKLLAKIALNDYDCVILSHDNYKGLAHTEEVERMVIDEQMAQLDAALEYLYGTGDKSQLTKKQIKGLETRKANLEARLAKVLDRKIDREFTFEGLGVDYLFVDECQEFKSLPYVSTYDRVAGLGSKEGSQKAVALLNGVRYLQKLHQGDRGTIFLSGTTISNSLSEIYHLLNYLRPSELERLGMTTFDAWAGNFAIHSSELEYGVTNELKEKDRFRSLTNIPELSKMYAEIADVRNDYNLKLDKPKMRSHVVPVPQTEVMKEINHEIISLVKNRAGAYFGIIAKDNTPWGLLASTLSAKVAINPRLIDDTLEDEGGKIPAVCENVKKIYDKFAEQKGTQLIFCDTGIPSKGKRYDAYTDIINRLVNDYGIPREEIVDIHVANTAEKRKALFAKVNDGSVRILIGGTQNMGTGVNVQKRIVAMHHVDVPWTPADREQREGRGVRQGNEIAKNFNDNNVDVYFYATEGSLDMYKYQLQETKGKLFAQFKSGAVGERTFDEGDAEGDFDPAEVVARLSGNPVIFEKSKQDKKVEKLRRAKRAYESDWQRRKANFDYWKNRKRNLERLASGNADDVKRLERKGFVANEEGKYPNDVTVQVKDEYSTRRTFDKPKEAGEYILELLSKGKKVQLSGFGHDADITKQVDEDGMFAPPEATLNAWSGIKYVQTVSDDAVVAGQTFRVLLSKVYRWKEIYKESLAEAEEKLKGADPGENKFPKQAELDEAIEVKKRLDEEYKKLSDEGNEGNTDADSGVRMRLVEDKEEIERLEAEPKSEGYRNVVLNDDQKKSAVEQLATKLGVKVNIVDDVNSITHGNEKQQERRRNANGWYNTSTGEVTIVLPNNRNVDDVVATTLHEVVAHKGLREMVGEERYNEFLDEIYSHLKKDLKEKVDKMAFDMFMNGLGKSKDTMKEYRRVAVDELLGRLAEKGFEDFTESEKSIWQKLKEAVLKILDKFLDTLKLPKKFTLGDNELRYILWRSKERMERGKESPLDMAKDNIKRRELKLNDGDLYSSTETDDIWNDNSLSMSEKIASVKVRLAQNQRDNKTLRNEALQQLGTSLSDLRKAMRLQRDFDQSTVKRVSDLARIMMKGGYLRGLGASDFDSILAAVKNSVGHDNVEGAVQRLMDIMIDNQLKNAERVLKALETIKGKKVNESGVEVMGELDPRGQRMMEVFKKVRRWKPEDIENAINNALDRMGSDDNAVAEEAANEYAGLMLAQNYVDTIIASEVEEAELRKEIKETHDNASESDRRTSAYRDLIRSLNDAIRENKIERAEAYIDLAQRMGADLKQSIENAKDFKDLEKMRINEIHHNANSDMEGRPAKEHYQSKVLDALANSEGARFFLAPLNTFFEMLRMFGYKSADGEGYTFNRFGRGWVDARNKEIKGVRSKFRIIDNKIADIFGGKIKSAAELIWKDKKFPMGSVTIKNGGTDETFKMTQLQLLYIYMTNKMLDGDMKLRKMGISESDVEKIADFLDPKLLEFADWIQREFLVNCRNEYNQTHKRVFGASMAAIEDYFPLNILKNAIDVKAEDLDRPKYNNGISVIVGPIIKRNRNTKPLDILHSNAISLLLEHVATMEHWNAFCEFNRDLNTLRTYKRLRVQLNNMATVYGSGDELLKNFDAVCQIAVGAYHPDRGVLDKSAVNIAKGYTASAIVARMFTAYKQLESILAYIPYVRADKMFANLVNPKKAWDWTLENLPILEERWRSRIAGDPRLLKTEVDWKMWRTKTAEIAQRLGMTPNAFMDMVSVAIGAHAIYQTRYPQYIKDGYSAEEANHRALQDSAIIPNETQQSSESAFLSPMQVSKTWVNVLFTIFRNASMGYQRRLHNSLRNFKHNLVTVGKEKSIEFMKKQFVRDGMDEDVAEANARRKFNRQLFRDFLSLATFGCIVQMGWNLMPYLPYMLAGNDEEEKDKMWQDVMAHTAGAAVEGLTGGDVMSEVVRQIVTKEGLGGKVLGNLEKEMPVTKALKEAWKDYSQDKGAETLNDIVNIVVATSIGVNPQTITDAVVAIMDACGDDPALAHEATLFAFRVLQVPQSQIDKLYFDEVGLSGEEASKYSMEELAERYARYKVKRGRFFAPWSWDDKEALGKAKKKAQKAIKERVDRLGGKEQNDKYAEYEEKYKAIADEVKAAKEVGEKNKKKGDAMLDALYNDKEKKGLYDTFKKLDKGLDDLAKRYLKAINENEAELYHNAIEEYKQLAVKVLESPDSISREKNEKELKALLDRVFKEMKEIEE